VDRLDAGAGPSLLVVLCHGFGAPGSDLVPVGGEVLSLAPALADRVQFVMPAAPLSLADQGIPGGRAWWPLDVMQLTAAIERGEFRDQRAVLPPELPTSRQMLSALIEELSASSGLPLEQIVLGGFSQGSMLATDVALRLPQSPAALCIWSGTLLCEEEWRSLAERRGRLRVLQSHGTQDPLLPFEAAVWLRDMLLEAGLDVEFLPFEGMHTIPLPALVRLADLLSELVDT
jgi:phospholipase/carboxylesterase